MSEAENEQAPLMENPWPRINAAADVARSRGRRGSTVEAIASSVLPDAVALAEAWRKQEAEVRAAAHAAQCAEECKATAAHWAACVAAGAVGPKVGLRIATGTVHIWVPAGAVAVATGVRCPRRLPNTIALDAEGRVIQSWRVDQVGPDAWAIPGTILPGTDMADKLTSGRMSVVRPGPRSLLSRIFGG